MTSIRSLSSYSGSSPDVSSAAKLLKAERRLSDASNSSLSREMGSNVAPRFQQLRLWLRNPGAKFTILFWSTVISGIIQLGLKIACLVMFSCLDDKEAPPKAVWIVFYGINLLLLLISLGSTIIKRYWFFHHTELQARLSKYRSKSGDSESLLQESKGEPLAEENQEKLSLWGRVNFVANIISVSFIMITSVVLMANTAAQILTLPTYTGFAALVIGFEATDCAFAAIYLILDVIYESMKFAMVSQAITVVVSSLNILVAILSVWANMSGRIAFPWFDDNDDRDFGKLGDAMRHSRAFPYFGVVIAAASGVGLTTGLSLDASNRLSDLGVTLSSIHIFASVVSGCISTAWFAMSCYNLHAYLHADSHVRDLMIANPLISFAGLVFSVASILAMLKVRARPQTHLQVEEYDLSSLTSDQLEVWARLVDVYNKKGSSNPDVAAGHEALSLFKAYAESPMDHMNCRVLRVFDTGTKAYENIKAWDKLDSTTAFEDDEASLLPNRKESFIDRNAEEMRKGPEKLSKNAAKKAERKAAKKAAKKAGGAGAGASATVGTVHQQLQMSPEETKRNIQFRNDLIATEALVLLTCIEDYDLLSSVSNTWFGKLAERLIGAKSSFKMTCIRMGLLATHWPFRQAILFTAPTKKPNARAAAVCRSIADYNKRQPRSKRCTMILNPTVAHRGMERAIRPSGWAAVPLPPSHVVDLRPYQGNSLHEYLKKIKYRDQAKAFQKAHGEVIETSNFTAEDCRTAIDLWWNIASKRLADGNTSVLANPTADFLQSLGSIANEKGYRSILFLTVEDRVIASAVLFRLGDTITSDIQGLDHELARKYNAYFVMMQETINIALKTGLKFVDFGPTTSQPKMAIGSKEVDIFGGIYARAPLSWFITWFSGNVHVDEG